MTGFIPYTKIIGAGLSNIGSAFNGDEVEEHAPGGKLGGALTGGVNMHFMSTKDRQEYDRNWLEQFGGSMRGQGQEVQMERGIGDMLAGDGMENQAAWSQQNVNPDENTSGWAQGLGGLVSKIPWGSFGGS